MFLSFTNGITYLWDILISTLMALLIWFFWSYGKHDFFIFFAIVSIAVLAFSPQDVSYQTFWRKGAW